MTELSPVDELAEMEERTNKNGLVDVTIKDWNKYADDRVKVEFQVIDTIHSEIMPWPEPGADFDDYKFSRLVDSCGLEMRNAELLSGSEAHAIKRNGNWKLVTGTSRLTRFWNVIKKNLKRAKNVDIMSNLIRLTYLAGFIVMICTTVISL